MPETNNSIIKGLKTLFFSLDKENRRKYIMLQFIVVIAAIAELMSISLISPYIEYISSDIKTGIWEHIKLSLGWTGDASFELGVSLLIFLFFASVLSALSIWVLAHFAARLGVNIADELFHRMATSSYLELSKNDKSNLINLITNESTRLTDQIIQPLMIINSKILLVVAIASVMIYLSPSLSLFSLLMFLSTYLVLYMVVRRRLERNGNEITSANRSRLFLIEDTVGLFKELKVYSLLSEFNKSFKSFGNNLATRKGQSAAISQVPRFIIEYLALSIIILAFIIERGSSSNIVDVVATMSGFGAAAFKLLPAAQQIYQSVAVIKANSSALFEILNVMSLSRIKNTEIEDRKLVTRPHFSNKIKYSPINFSLTNGIKILDEVDFEIKKGQRIGIVGASGAGKSTFISHLLGLIEANDLSVDIDGKKFTNHSVNYKSLFGYVPQDLFIIRGNIVDNIALCEGTEEVDFDRISKCLKLTRMYDYVKGLPNGLNTLIDNNSQLLSGGQKQRIIIARALYRNPSILVFDEATSALDGINENMIINSIVKENSEQTIVMIAHRLISLVDCDIIYVFENGKIVESGRYKNLIEKSEVFKKLNGSSNGD